MAKAHIRGSKNITLCAILILLILIVLSIKNLIFYLVKNECNVQQACELDISKRLDCHPEPGASKDTCIQRGCCWVPLNGSYEDKEFIPYCFFSKLSDPFYIIGNYTNNSNIEIYLSMLKKSSFPDNVKLLKLQIDYHNNDMFRITIRDATKLRYEVPLKYNFVPNNHINPKLGINMDQENMKLQIFRKSTNQIIFEINLSTLIYSDQMLQLSYSITSTCLYGIGEHQEAFCLDMDWNKIGIFASDEPPDEGKALYGAQPFYLSIESNTSSHGALFLNSNAMEFLLQPAPMITFRAIGGIIDMFVFAGPSPADVIRQYTDLVGKPFMPPYWSLGFHLSRFGYNTLDNMNQTLTRNLDAGIPVDVQWNDIDAMENYTDFTYDRNRFKNLPSYVANLHLMGLRYISIIDSGIYYDSVKSRDGSTYAPLSEGLKAEIFVRNSSGQPLIGRVWPGPTVWPDFSHPDTSAYWTKLVTEYRSVVAIDGAWIDMNEPANFVDGSLDGCTPNSTLDHPPYLTRINGPTLNYRTICMSAQQYQSCHYNMHNLYGYQEAVLTNEALSHAIPNKRPFIITRSNFVGLGVHAGHWTGDVYSTWHGMARTIPAILNYNLFGIPMIGADVCGFNGNTTGQLCNRWIQLGAFYPFSRTHNTDDAMDQDPASFLSSDPLLVSGARVALVTRYSLLPYLYTLFYLSHLYGDTVARPLFFEYPSDPNTYTIDDQFLWGPSLMISPVLIEDTYEIDSYFPGGADTWFDFYNGSRLTSVWTVNGNPNVITLDAPYTKINLHVKAGSIIPLQEPAASTYLSRQNAYWLLVALDDNLEGQGIVYIDDGETLNQTSKSLGTYNLVKFVAHNDTLVSIIQNFDYLPSGEVTSLLISNVTFFGLARAPANVYINNYEIGFRYTGPTKVLYVENLKIVMKYPFSMKWDYSSN